MAGLQGPGCTQKHAHVTRFKHGPEMPQLMPGGAVQNTAEIGRTMINELLLIVGCVVRLDDHTACSCLQDPCSRILDGELANGM